MPVCGSVREHSRRRKREERVGAPGITGSCEPPCGAGNRKPSLKRQQVLLPSPRSSPLVSQLPLYTGLESVATAIKQEKKTERKQT